MKNGIINELKFASKKKKNAVLGYVYCDYLLDMFEEIEFLKNNERIAIDCQNKLSEEIERLNNRIEKAIDFLKENACIDEDREILDKLQELNGADK